VIDAIIGNPPYQVMDGGAQASAKPIYQLFIQQAMELNPKYISMITPSRWFAGGKGLDDFRKAMLKDKRIKAIHDYPNASEVFPSIEIKGGVNYFLWDKEYKGDCLIRTYENGVCVSALKRPLKENNADVFIRYNEAIPILRKIQSFNEKSFSELMSSAKPFGLRTYFKGERESFEGAIKIYVNGGIGYIKKKEVLKNQHWIKEHKVIVPYAIGSGDSKTDKVNPIYAEPNSCCTETYLVIGPFATKKQCENVMQYIGTKFLHFCLTLKKNTQHSTKEFYQFVPQQNFDEEWTDEKLYKKYGLTPEEIAYIEKMIRPME